MGKEKEKKQDVQKLNVHAVYSLAGGRNKLGGFGFATPEQIGILQTVLVSPDGKHRAVFSHEKHRGRYCNIRITHGKHRGLTGDLDATSRTITEKETTSGWFWWRPETLPQFAQDAVDKLKSVKEKPAKAKPAKAKPVTVAQGTAAASMGGLES
jgi:hypothetical protein